MAEENNIGASRLLGTNGLQQAVDSLTTQVNKVSMDVGKLASSLNAMTGAYNRSTGSSSSNGGWNTGSNRNQYGANGGGGRFTGLAGFGGRGNGGGGSFGQLGSGSRLSAGFAALTAIGGAAANYGNQNLAGMMQQNYYGTQAAQLSGNVTQANVNNATRYAMGQLSYGALNAADVYKASYIGQYTFGAPMNANGSQNTYYRQMMGQAFGLGITPNMSMGQIAQNLYGTVFGNQKISMQGFSQAARQGGSLQASLASMGNAMGWSGQTQQEYMSYIQGMVLAQNKGMSQSQYTNLMSQASGNGKAASSARSQLQAIGVGTSAFEAQRNLNSTRMNRQEDINESMAVAFKNTTNVVNQFSQAMTAMMKATGMDKLIGTAAGTASPISNALSGFSNVFGMGAGLYTAARMFGGGGGGGMPFFGGFRGGGGGGTGIGSPLGGTPGPGGVYNITSMGPGLTAAGGTEAAMTAAGPVGLTILAAAGAGAATQNSMNAMMNKNGAQTSAFMKAALDWESQGQPFFGKQKVKSRADWNAFVAKWYAANPGAKVDPKTYNMLMSQTQVRTLTKLNPGTGQAGGALNSIPGGGGSVGNGAANMGANAAEIIKLAETQLNVPYGWGQESPGKAFDCSGLLQWAYGQAGVKIPRVAADQQKTGSAVSVNNTQPGDLLFVGNPAHHVVMNAGNGQIIEAPHTGASVRLRSLNPSEFDSATRIVGAVGDVSSLLGGSQSPATLNQTSGNSGGDIGGGSSTSELANLMAALATGAGGGGSVGLQATGNGAAAATGATGGSITKGNGQNDKASLQAYAKQLLSKYGWAGEWDAFNSLVMSESGWDVHATNPSSGAYGIPQSLPGNKMSSAGSDWQTNGDTQLMWMMQYIKGRYGDPNQAWSFHQKNNWYATGAYNIDKDQNAVVHKGEMIIPAKQAESIRQVLMNNQFNPGLTTRNSGGGLSIGTINVNMPSGYSGTATEAKTTGKLIVDAIDEYTRVKNLQTGV